MSDTIDPDGLNNPDGLTNAEEILAEQQYAAEVLDYKPDLEVPLKTGTATGTSSISTTGGLIHPNAQQIVDLIATQLDAEMLSAYISSLLIQVEMYLANTKVDISGIDNVPQASIDLITAALGSTTISFADVKNALQNQQEASSVAILLAWARYQWSPLGDISAQMYSNIYGYSLVMPMVIDLNSRLIALQNYSQTGTIATDVDSNISSLQTVVNSGTYNLTQEQLAGYGTAQDTLSAVTSNITYSVSNIVSGINADTNSAQEALGMVQTFQAGFPNSKPSDLAEILAVLETIKTLYTIYNANSWLSISAIENLLLGIAEDLELLVLGEAMVVYSHLQSQLLTPIVNVLRQLDNIFVFVKDKHADQFMKSIFVLLDGTIGKFNQQALDFYRKQQLQTNQTNSKFGQVTENNSLRNYVIVLNELISVLQSLNNSSSINWDSIGNSVTNTISSLKSPNPILSTPPTTTIPRPPSTASMVQVVSGPDGLGSQSNTSSTQASPATWGATNITSSPSATITSLVNARANA